MTVGELITRRIPVFRDGHPDRSWIIALSSLGIWDAEVLEGKVHHGFDTDCAGFYPLDGSESRSLAGLIDPSYGGEPVRIIVLPQEEK